MESEDRQSAASVLEGHNAMELDSSINPERVVFVAKRGWELSGFDVFSLEEPSEDVREFRLVSQTFSTLPSSFVDEFLLSEAPDYLAASASRQVHVVVSTRSGTGLALDFYNSILTTVLGRLGLESAELASDTASAVTSGGRSYGLVITDNADSIAKFVEQLGTSTQSLDRTNEQHTVILLSGDGGIIEMLNARAHTDLDSTLNRLLPVIAVLPLGTGNALFNSLHKPVYALHGSAEPSPLVLGLRTLLKGRQAPLPSFCARFSPNSRLITYRSSEDQVIGSTEAETGDANSQVSQLWGAIVASYGFHSQLVWESDTPEYRKHGSKRFGMVAANLLQESHAYNATVEIRATDGSAPKTIPSGKHAYILATMVSNLEKTFTISPASRPLDGKLRLVHFGAVSGERTMEIMTQAYNNGRHVGMQWDTEDGSTGGVGYEDIEQVTVTTLETDPRWRKVCIDGTIVELPEGGFMTVTTESTPRVFVLVHWSLDNHLNL
ncbi:ATP-NAD kinase-like domain-containing protein [Xylariales sp. PMI_506]|nr:ATP-NAD kinase-like domain-containing protein [Xylariales sp. PMI_506]